MSQSVQTTTKHVRPGIGHWFLHIRKTARLLWSLLRDPRVNGFRKFAFVAFIIIFGGVLLIPDSIVAGLVAAALPFLSPFFDIPAGVIDIAALATVMYGLLNFFPKAVVSEHTTRLYGPNPDIKPHN